MRPPLTRAPLARRPVVVTGLGVVGSFGVGREAFAALLAGGRPVLREVERPPGYHHPRSARRAALVDPAALASLVPPAAARRMSPPSRYAVAAGRLALADAAAPAGPEAGPTACILASAYGPTSFTEKLLRQILLEGPEAASPFLFTECVANAPSAQVAIALGARGPNVTLTQREAGPLLAVARAAELVATGRADRAFAGTAEEMSPLLHAVLDRFHALSREDEPRPFDAARTGFVAAEGATVVLLEAEEVAAARGARPLARVAGYGRGFDPGALSTGWGAGEGLACAIVGALTMAGGDWQTVDRVVSGASGTVAGDRVEARALREAWAGAPLPPVHAPKGITGEYAGGHLAAAVLALGGAPIACPAGYREPDPALGVAPYSGPPLPAPRRILASAAGAGGAAAYLVLDRP